MHTPSYLLHRVLQCATVVGATVGRWSYVLVRHEPLLCCVRQLPQQCVWLLGCALIYTFLMSLLRLLFSFSFCLTLSCFLVAPPPGPRTIDPSLAAIDPSATEPGASFPVTSVRDNVRAQHALLAALGVRRVAMAVGGSLGGMVALEWAALYPDLVDSLVLIACAAAHSAVCIVMYGSCSSCLFVSFFLSFFLSFCNPLSKPLQRRNS
jgi:hypothetical protein